LIHLGVQLGLFKALAERPGATVRLLAEQLGLQAPYVERWCMTAYGMALLEAQGEGYALAPFYDSILASPSHPRYLGGYVQLGAKVAARDFMHCLEAFRTGKYVPFQGRGDAFNLAVASATWGLQLLTAKKILPELPGLSQRLAQGGSVLEIGCGTGNCLVQIGKSFPAARVIGVDIDAESLAIAQQRIAAAGLSERVEAKRSDLAELPAASFDAVVMVEVLHEIGVDVRPHVVRDAARALKPGGWMVIVDETYPSTLEQARQAEFMFPLHTGFEELLWGNVIPTREEQEALLRGAGFDGQIARSLIGEGFTVLATKKVD
jgi:SAM-dependent methyltransferase